ncbi:clarin-2-like [Tachypleus tridentatus]|uniref:clarin-2-like n=1 Tax=Tachypleus tridentatus TaxID=6853 RepID=UPI003FD076D7
MDLVKRALTFLTFFVCCISLAFLAASFATQSWIEAEPIRTGIKLNSTSSYGEDKKFVGTINFGLFKGEKVLDYGLGPRKSHIWIKTELLKNPTLMVFGLWLFTIICVALSMVFGLVGAIFAVINTVIVPVELITGMVGLYLWNCIGAVASLAAVLSWVVQYYVKLQKNVMTEEEIGDKWTSEGQARLGSSFWFVIVALVLYVLNIFIIKLAQNHVWEHRQPKSTTDKNPEGAIMLY